MTEPKQTNETVRLEKGGLAAARARSDAAQPGSALLLVEVRGADAPFDARTVALDEGMILLVGRDPDCDIHVDDGSLSRRHARFGCSHALSIEDLGSTNGTAVNGVPLTAHHPQILVAGDQVRLGAALITVHTALGAGQRRVIIPHERFLIAVDDEIARARVFSRGFSLALVRVPGAHVGQLVPSALAALRPVDRAAAFGDDVLELMLTEMDATAATRVVQGIVSAAGVTAASAIASFPEDGTTGDALVAAALASLGTPGVVPRRAPSQRARVIGHASTPVIASPVMRELFVTLDRVARSAIPVLLVGETGSGKEVVARSLHERSPRSAAPLVAVNCGAIPPTLVESTLFGHEKGAFTGATDTHKGVFETAHGGSVFLDEVGELPLSAQTALLRVLESRAVTRVGGTAERPVDARLIAATHRDLDAMVAAGTFRQDLLYRMNAMTVAIPPLRERPEEITPLATAFLEEANRRHTRAVAGFSSDALELLLAWRWPGNVRELKNAVERAVVIAQREHIDVDDLPAALRGPRRSAPRRELAAPIDELDSAAMGSGGLGDALERVEARLILEALDQNGQSVAETAEALQMPKRTLQHRMKLLGIQRKVGYGR